MRVPKVRQEWGRSHEGLTDGAPRFRGNAEHGVGPVLVFVVVTSALALIPQNVRPLGAGAVYSAWVRLVEIVR